MLDHAKRCFNIPRELYEIASGEHGAVEEVVVLVGDQGSAIIAEPQRRLRHDVQEPPSRLGPAEAHHLHGQEQTFPESVDELRPLGDNDEPLGGGHHQLFAKQRGTVPLD
jgi:hypothetical protein